MTDLRYPLHWPAGRPRRDSSKRDRARYGSRTGEFGALKKLTVAQAIGRLWDEIAVWGYSRIPRDAVIISSNLVLKRDGEPRSGQPEPADPGVVVYLELDKEPLAIDCDRWDRSADNIAAIAYWLSLQRGGERCGVGSIAATFRGYQALPPVASGNTWYTVLGLVKMPSNVGELRAAFRKIAIANHPDVGGDSERWLTLTAAYSQGMDALGGDDGREAL